MSSHLLQDLSKALVETHLRQTTISPHQVSLRSEFSGTFHWAPDPFTSHPDTQRLAKVLGKIFTKPVTTT